MSENPESSNERPCLHCLIGDLIDEYYAEYGTSTGETDVIDIDETISALAKTIADLTYGSDIAARQRVKDDLTVRRLQLGQHCLKGGVPPAAAIHTHLTLEGTRSSRCCR